MRRARRVTVPHRVNELASGDNLPSPQSKETQHQALLRRARTQPAVIRAHPDGPKEPDRDFTAHRPHPAARHGTRRAQPRNTTSA